jgi:DNA-binding protein H-NS
MPMPKLSKLSVGTLLQLRADVEKMLATKANELKSQLARLGGEVAPRMRERGSALRGRKVPAKYRSRTGETWAGRGARPRWLVAAIKEGKRLEDFLIQPSARKRRKK